MSLTTSILQIIIPVLAMIAIGCFCNKRQIFNTQGLQGLKNIIANITLPVVLFNAFFTAEYNSRILLVFAIIFTSCVIALLLGFALRRFVSPYGKFFPFLLTSFEGGMLGYTLFGLLVGKENMSTFAIVDIGQTMFAYTAFLIALKFVDGQKATPKSISMTMLKTPPFIGMALGIILGALGLNNLIADTSFGLVFSELISFISAPTAAIILIIIGYELSIKKSLIKPVLKTVFIRLAIMATLCALSALVIFAFTPFDKNLMTALMLLFSLPAPFIIPLFADVEEHGEYISTSLSVSTIMTIVIFIGIATYSVG